MNKKRICGYLVVFCLLFSLFVQKSETVNAQTGLKKTVKGSYAEGLASDREFTWKASYDDSYFYLTDRETFRSGEYLQGGLAKLSMVAAATAYREEYARQFLKNCKFTDIEYVTPKVTREDYDHVSFAVGFRKLGEDTIVAVLLRGTGGNYEWVSNFNLGTETVHRGFARAEAEVCQELERILKEKKVKGGLKFWIAGHSRGAAVGNLLAKRLTDEYGQDNVYAYTFATPRVATDAQCAGYENIFNYLNPGDFITELAPEDWGYARYGRDIVLAANKKKEMKKLFKKKLGITYAGYTAGEKKALIASFLDYGGESAADYYAPRANGATPAAFCQNGIAYLLAGDEVNGAINVLLYSYGDPQAQALLGKLLTDGESSSGFVHAHCLTGYLSWLEAMY